MKKFIVCLYICLTFLLLLPVSVYAMFENENNSNIALDTSQELQELNISIFQQEQLISKNDLSTLNALKNRPEVLPKKTRSSDIVQLSSEELFELYLNLICTTSEERIEYLKFYENKMLKIEYEDGCFTITPVEEDSPANTTRAIVSTITKSTSVDFYNMYDGAGARYTYKAIFNMNDSTSSMLFYYTVKEAKLSKELFGNVKILANERDIVYANYNDSLPTIITLCYAKVSFTSYTKSDSKYHEFTLTPNSN